MNKHTTNAAVCLSTCSTRRTSSERISSRVLATLYGGQEPRDSDTCATEAFYPYRLFEHWNHKPWLLDYGGHGMTEPDDAFFLLPYYMRLYRGFMIEG